VLLDSASDVMVDKTAYADPLRTKVFATIGSRLLLTKWLNSAGFKTNLATILLP